MSLGLPNLTNTNFQNHIYRQSKVAGQSNSVDFNSILSAKGTETAEKLQRAQDTNTSREEEYKKYLETKYGKVSIRSVGKDQASLDRIGKSMSGQDVVIAQNILKEMANDPEKADYYEKKIDYFFDKIPEYTAYFAAKGLKHEPGGVVIHEDGTVTYISGCSDSPERVAQVEAENKAKREKEAKQRKEILERSQEAAEKQRQLIGRQMMYKKVEVDY